ncbi:hypothetical protein O3M35_002643 [Rhynocoris fuscipes]|uniref:Uncharacterized protein n=1 Tax=Rhynocoris fuscipes TaxID=488301 RepID=A0AAW1CST1_9HEMI
MYIKHFVLLKKIYKSSTIKEKNRLQDSRKRKDACSNRKTRSCWLNIQENIQNVQETRGHHWRYQPLSTSVTECCLDLAEQSDFQLGQT